MYFRAFCLTFAHTFVIMVWAFCPSACLRPPSSPNHSDTPSTQSCLRLLLSFHSLLFAILFTVLFLFSLCCVCIVQFFLLTFFFHFLQLIIFSTCHYLNISIFFSVCHLFFCSGCYPFTPCFLSFMSPLLLSH